jgi:hypothetical protein
MDRHPTSVTGAVKKINCSRYRTSDSEPHDHPTDGACDRACFTPPRGRNITKSLAHSPRVEPETLRSYVALADDGQHPFGNLATASEPVTSTAPLSALGFAPQPCDWFALSRMNDATGPSFISGSALPLALEVVTKIGRERSSFRWVARSSSPHASD